MFEDFETMITGLVNSVKAGASNTWDSIGLKSKIESAKKDIAKIYGDIGEKFYTENKDNIPPVIVFKPVSPLSLKVNLPS